MKPGRSIAKAGFFIASIVLAMIVLLPIVWGVILSHKTRVDALSMPPQWIFAPTLSNYKAAFVDGPYARTLLNSLIIAGASSMLAMALGLPAAYAFSRKRFRGDKRRSSGF